jgi:hypothetical protein
LFLPNSPKKPVPDSTASASPFFAPTPAGTSNPWVSDWHFTKWDRVDPTYAVDVGFDEIDGTRLVAEFPFEPKTRSAFLFFICARADCLIRHVCANDSISSAWLCHLIKTCGSFGIL